MKHTHGSLKNKKEETICGPYDVVVVGAGHAGCEAAIISARMGAKTLLATMNLFTTAQMSCNPAIGGLAKGHLVREIDVLGGEMAMNTDRSGIQFRMLNKSKGPAVWSPRAQTDRMEYSLQMRQALERQKNLHLKQLVVDGLIVKNKKVKGVKLRSGFIIESKAVILTMGTFLNGRIFIGQASFPGGRAGDFPVHLISDELENLGFKRGRLKTGTPPRVDGKTVDFTAMTIQNGDIPPPALSYRTDKIKNDQTPCFLTQTTPETHDVLSEGLDRSPLYTGMIKAAGPRYCPSIEDKIVRFSDRDHHQIFLEPEGLNTSEFYVNGFSSSLPEDIQIRALRTIPGMEKAEITRFAYAVEYDFFPADQIISTMETKRIKNLYFAGQINGTSGYEEAAAQGLMAGINSVLKIREEEPFILDRSEAYIGVLIDDLVTRAPVEPYRMFTSRAEYRLLLRQDNADIRLYQYGEKYGLLPNKFINRTRLKEKSVSELLKRLKAIKLSPEEASEILTKYGSSQLFQRESLFKLLKRPEIPITSVNHCWGSLVKNPQLQMEIEEQAEIEIKYQGYFNRQKSMIKKMENFENCHIPEDFDYDQILSFSKESREKLKKHLPRSLGQASRIDGVRASDISILMVYMEKQRKTKELFSQTKPLKREKGKVQKRKRENAKKHNTE